jgi:hypothetical protein
VDTLRNLRGRAAYWEKRIELEKGERKKQQLEIFAVAELARLIIREGMRVYGVGYSKVFEQVVEQQFAIARQQHSMESSGSTVFGASDPTTASRRKMSKSARARAAREGRSRATD